MVAERVQRPAEADEVARDQFGSLVDELVERVLAVGAWLAPVDGSRLVVDDRAVQRDVLAVALHGQLLEIGREAFEVLVVRQDRNRLGAEEVVVPDGEQPHEHRQVLVEWSGTEVLVHGAEAGEHGAKVFGANGDHGRKTDGRVHRVAAADPVPEPEHVRRVDAELRHFFGVGRDGDEVPGYGLFVAAAISAPTRARCGHWSSSRGS